MLTRAEPPSLDNVSYLLLRILCKYNNGPMARPWASFIRNITLYCLAAAFQGLYVRRVVLIRNIGLVGYRVRQSLKDELP